MGCDAGGEVVGLGRFWKHTVGQIMVRRVEKLSMMVYMHPSHRDRHGVETKCVMDDLGEG